MGHRKRAWTKKCANTYIAYTETLRVNGIHLFSKMIHNYYFLLKIAKQHSHFEL